MQENAYLVFEELAKREHEQVVFCRDEASGLRAIIGIHSTELGPALGGCRMYPYKSEHDALVDVLRLSRGMTYKAAVSGLNLGGGKTVVIGDPKKHKSEPFWRALGRFIEGLSGRYITAEDAGTTMEDMELIRMETSHVVGIARSLGGSGDPSPVTALGTFSGMRAAVEEGLGKSSLEGLRVAVQGVGHVGYHLVGHLVRAGAVVTVTDVDAESARRAVHDFRVEAVAPEAIYDVPCDIFAPCAMGGILNENTIGRLRCRVIAGAANNQLSDEKIDGQRLAERDILYAPDFVINAGGLINVANELEGYNQERALSQATRVYDVLRSVLARAKSDNIPTYRAANNLAMERIESLSRIRRTYTGKGAVMRHGMGRGLIHPRIDLHATAAAWGVDLSAAFTQLQAVYADVDARNARNTQALDLPCHRGCDMCCHESVFLTPLEFFYVWDWAQNNLSEAVRQEIVDKGLALYDVNRGLIDALDAPLAEGERDHFTVAEKIRFTCPILGQDGGCRVYPVREIFARLFGSSFHDDSSLYGCHLVTAHLAGKTVTLLPARATARRLHDLPLTGKRQVYPYYFNLLYGQAGEP